MKAKGENTKIILPPKNKGGAPKGNKNAVGNNGGRPPLYSDPTELDKKVCSYIQSFKDDKTKKRTMTGFAIECGFNSLDMLHEYRKKVEFSDSIKKGMFFVMNGYEEKLYEGQCTGAIFALKNMGWSDKTEHELTGKDGKDLPLIVFKDFRNEQQP